MSDDDDFNVYNQAQVAFQRLSPKEGDIIAVYFPDDIHPQQMALVAEEIQHHVPDGVAVACLRKGVQMELLDERQMEELGWVRISKVPRKLN